MVDNTTEAIPSPLARPPLHASKFKAILLKSTLLLPSSLTMGPVLA